jgi:hypothetical protein
VSARAAVSAPATIDVGSALVRATALACGAVVVLMLIPAAWLELLARDDSRVGDSPVIIVLFFVVVATAPTRWAGCSWRSGSRGS